MILIIWFTETPSSDLRTFSPVNNRLIDIICFWIKVYD